MPQRHRLLNPDRTEPAMQVVMQVRSADPAIRDSDLGLARAGRQGILEGIDPQIARAVDDNRFHARTFRTGIDGVPVDRRDMSGAGFTFGSLSKGNYGPRE